MKVLVARLAWAIIPIISGCQTGTPLDDYIPSAPPAASGFPSAPPRDVKSVVVWGNDDRIVGAATAWLTAHGLNVMGRERISWILEQDLANQTAPVISEHSILAAAGQVNADAVVFADRMDEARPPMVEITGVSPRSGRLIWIGTARFEPFEGLPGTETFAVLTDYALSKAWGLKPKED